MPETEAMIPIGPRRVIEYFLLLVLAAVLSASLSADWIITSLVVFVAGTGFAVGDVPSLSTFSSEHPRWGNSLARATYFLIGGAFGAVLAALVVLVMYMAGYGNLVWGSITFQAIVLVMSIVGYIAPKILSAPRAILTVLGLLVPPG